MKTRLKLTIDNALLENMKAYALKRGTTISELVEYYFKTVTKPAKRKEYYYIGREARNSCKGRYAC